MSSKLFIPLSEHKKEVFDSIKLIEVEEKFDLYFSRFFGLYFAKIGERLNATPTQVSLASLVIGMIGGALLFFQEEWPIILVGSFFITLAGVLDSADGQLARRTGQSTPLGKIIDGAIDNAVFFACYFGACLYYLVGDIGWVIVPIGLVTGFGAHSFTSNIYEFYKSEFLYFVGNKTDEKATTVDEVKIKVENSQGWSKYLYHLLLDYTKKRQFFTYRKGKVAEKFEESFTDPKYGSTFSAMYKEQMTNTLFWWAWIGGTNVHRTLMMGFSLIGRFDLYIITVLLKFIPFLVLIWYQKKKDQKLLAEFEQLTRDAVVSGTIHSR